MGLEVTYVSPEPEFFVFDISKEGMYFINFLYRTEVRDYNITPSEECISISFINKENRSQFDIYSNVEKILDRFTLMKF